MSVIESQKVIGPADIGKEEIVNEIPEDEIN